MSMWRKTLVYLGLVEELEEVVESEMETDEPALAVPESPNSRRPPPSPPPPAPRRRARRDGAVATATPPVEVPANVRPLPVPEDRPSHVRQLHGASVRVVRAVAFDDAEQVGERYRTGQPILLDLAEVDGRIGRRLLDFVSGVVFALDGRILPAGERAFMLVPDDIEVTVDERRRLGDLGYRVPADAPLEEG